MAKKTVFKPRAGTAAGAKIGERIRAARIKAGMSQEKLGKALGLTFQQVQKYEKGTNRVASDRLGTIAEVLDTTVNALLGRGTDDKPREEDNALLSMMGTREGQRLIKGFHAMTSGQRHAFVSLIEAIIT